MAKNTSGVELNEIEDETACQLNMSQLGSLQKERASV